MKRILLCLTLAVLLLLAACSGQPTESESAASAPSDAVSVPPDAGVVPELIGVWVSADPGELDMVETITFSEDGTMSVNLRYQGEDYDTVFGAYAANEQAVFCDLTNGTTAYQVQYAYHIDGRMLTLIDSEGSADYLRTS